LKNLGFFPTNFPALDSTWYRSKIYFENKKTHNTGMTELVW